MYFFMINFPGSCIDNYPSFEGSVRLDIFRLSGSPYFLVNNSGFTLYMHAQQDGNLKLS